MTQKTIPCGQEPESVNEAGHKEANLDALQR